MNIEELRKYWTAEEEKAHIIGLHGCKKNLMKRKTPKNSQFFGVWII